MKRFIFLVITIVLVSCQSFDKSTNVIYLVGDSTMANKKENKRPETGWGEMLGEYFENGVKIENHAVNGRSTKSFRDEGKWQVVLDKLQKNDVVFIQFGHNDSKVKSPERYASPKQYRVNLIRFVEEVRAKQAIPVLLTSVVRRKFVAGKLQKTHGDYPKMVREVAQEMNVMLIDIQQKSEKLLIEKGEVASKKLYLWLNKGENPNYPEGVSDNTHFSVEGAKVMASLVTESILKSELAIKKYLKSL
ncbi:MAG: rhamnogalacturonan acetylesterase [Saprospiraceae bacterium]